MIRVAKVGQQWKVMDVNQGPGRLLDALPQWAENSIALLRLVDRGDKVQGIGFSYGYDGQDIFYLEPKGDINEGG